MNLFICSFLRATYVGYCWWFLTGMGRLFFHLTKVSYKLFFEVWSSLHILGLCSTKCSVTQNSVVIQWWCVSPAVHSWTQNVTHTWSECLWLFCNSNDRSSSTMMIMSVTRWRGCSEWQENVDMSPTLMCHYSKERLPQMICGHGG